MKKSGKFLTTALVTGVAAVAGAVFYGVNRSQKMFTKEKWDADVSRRYKMADSLIREQELVGRERKEIMELLGVNGLRCNTKETMEYYLGLESEIPKLLIFDFDEEDRVTKCTACM